MTAALHFDTLLLPDGWARAVRVEVGSDGLIADVSPDCAPGADAARFAGPAVTGMPNLHSHAFQFAVAGCTEAARGATQDDFWSWRARMYAVAGAVSPADVEVIARALYIEMLLRGYTAVAEFHYLHGAPGEFEAAAGGDNAMARAIQRAARDAGIGLTLLPTLYMQRGFDGGACGADQRRFARTVAQHLAAIEELTTTDAGDGDFRVGLGLHSLRAVGPAALEAVLAGLDAVAPDAPIHIHIAEQIREVEDCVAWSGQRPIAWLLDHADVDARWCLVHATHAAPPEVMGVAERGAVVGICPTTEADLGDGILPATEYVSAGATIGVGSDQHVATCPATELRALEHSQRLLLRQRGALADSSRSAARRLWDDCARGGAQACGRGAGAVRVGSPADFVVLDTNAPRLAGLTGDDWLDHWVMAPGHVRVRDVVVRGRHVVRNGRHAAAAETRDALRDVLTRLRSR